MQSEGHLPPLYFIHDMSGDVFVYAALAHCFAPERPVYGIKAAAGLENSTSRCTVESLACVYIREILERQSSGPFHLAGYSSGATLAFEMAKQLAASGHQVGLVALIDAIANAPGPELSKPARYFKIASRLLGKIAFKLSDELKEGPKHFVSKRVEYIWLTWQVKRLREPSQSGDSVLSLQQILFLADNTYRPTPYSGSALLLRFHDQAWAFGPDPLMGWSSLLQSHLAVADVPGGHATGMRLPLASRLVDLLKEQMALKEAE
jgi:thioesterase domain-containing protein